MSDPPLKSCDRTSAARKTILGSRCVSASTSTGTSASGRSRAKKKALDRNAHAHYIIGPDPIGRKTLSNAANALFLQGCLQAGLSIGVYLPSSGLLEQPSKSS